MLAFNFFFLPPLHTFTLADSQQLVRAARVPRHRGRRQRAGGAVAAARAREAALLAEIATSLLRARPGHATSSTRIAERGGAARSRSSGAAIELGGAATPGRTSDTELIGRRPARRRRSTSSGRCGPTAARRRRLLPALASLLGVAIDRERLAARGARGGGAAAQRRDEDGAAARGQPRPAHAADGDPDLGRARSPATTSSSTTSDRHELLETILDRGRPARPARRATCSTSRGCRPARRSPTRRCARSTTWSSQALDELGRRRQACRGGAAGRARRRCASTPIRSSARSSTCSRTRSSTRRRRSPCACR